MLLSFILSPPRDESVGGKRSFQSTAAGSLPAITVSVKEKLGLLFAFLSELLARAEAEQQLEQDEVGFSSSSSSSSSSSASSSSSLSPFASLYESVCLVVLSRFLQNLHLREITREIFVRLRRVPPVCLQLLRLLMYTGSKAAVIVAPVAGKKEVKNRGTRFEAMALLSQVGWLLSN